MNTTEKLRYFKAVTYDDNTYNFVVTSDGGIYCLEFDIVEPASVIELKPNFVLRRKNGETIYNLDDFRRERKIPKSLIREWIIDDELFNELIGQRKILYSVQMALLYGLDASKSFDAHYQKRAFKSSRNNEEKRIKVLSKMKSGKFN